MQLSQFKALSFDCYGTLIDWEAGLMRALEPLRSKVGISQNELLEAFGDIEHEVEEERPGARYSELLASSMRGWRSGTARRWTRMPLAPSANPSATGPPSPTAPMALRYLKRHFELIILSNVDRASFARSNERLGVEFDRVFTAEEIGSYKPDLRNFEYLLERLGENGLEKGDLLHVAQSLFHDHAPANRFGIASAWIDRRHDKPGGGATKAAGADAALRFPLHLAGRTGRSAPRRACRSPPRRVQRRLYRRRMHRPLRLTIDSAALSSNWRWLAERAGVPAGAAVKADGYGLGAREAMDALDERRLPRLLRLDLGRGRGAWAASRRARASSCSTASGRTMSKRRWRSTRGRCSTRPSRSRAGRSARRTGPAT